MERIRDVPREHRVAFFAGFGITVTSANIVLVAVIYSTVANLPAMVAGALFFLTPVYFLHRSGPRPATGQGTSP